MSGVRGRVLSVSIVKSYSAPRIYSSIIGYRIYILWPLHTLYGDLNYSRFLLASDIFMGLGCKKNLCILIKRFGYNYKSNVIPNEPD